MTKLKLKAVVKFETVKTEGPNGRVKKLTHIEIRLGDAVYAEHTLPGMWSQEKAIKEFRRNPLVFTRIGDISLDMLAKAA